jgi:ABC-type sugar transport system permease subunit
MIRKKTDPYLLILPAILLVILVYFYPIYRVITDSFFTINGLQRTFVGLTNYRFILLEDTVFRTAVTNNLKLMISIPILVVMALTIAFLIYKQLKGWQFFRFVAVIPYILSITATAITFDYILRQNGLLNSILQAIGLGSLSRAWLGDASVALYAIMGVVTWKEFGFGVILFLARMLSVDSQTIEASIVDGASSFQTFYYVILPEMKNVILFYVVINMINMLSWMFNYIFVLTRGGPMQSTYVLEYYIYQTGIRYRQFGLSSALAVITLGIAIVLVMGQAVLRRRVAD